MEWHLHWVDSVCRKTIWATMEHKAEFFRLFISSKDIKAKDLRRSILARDLMPQTVRGNSQTTRCLSRLVPKSYPLPAKGTAVFVVCAVIFLPLVLHCYHSCRAEDSAADCGTHQLLSSQLMCWIWKPVSSATEVFRDCRSMGYLRITKDMVQWLGGFHVD